MRAIAAIEAPEILAEAEAIAKAGPKTKNIVLQMREPWRSLGLKLYCDYGDFICDEHGKDTPRAWFWTRLYRRFF